jgi:hypothetical protein
MNKGVAITFIVILSILAIVLTGGFIFLLRSNFTWGSFNLTLGSYSDKLVDSKTFTSAEEINVDTKAIDLFVDVSDDENITVELYSDKEVNYSFTNENDIVNLKAHINNYISFGFLSKSPRLVVKVPKEYAAKFTIDSKVGDIHIASFESLNPTIKSTTGDIKIEKVNESTIDVGTGDVKITEVKVLNIKQGTGDIKVQDVDSIDINANTGDVKIQKVNNKMNIINGTGDIKIQDAIINENSSITNRTGDIKIQSLSGAYIEADNKVGDVKVNNNDRHLELTCTIHTNTGDIRVN